MAKEKPSALKARWQGKGTISSTEGARISASVWGQLEPLDRVAREKMKRWGDSLPSLVSPDLAGRFEAAYDALAVYVECNDVVNVNAVVEQLIRAWDVLEQAAIAAGHEPLPEHAYCVDLGGDGGVVCIALHGVVDIRKQHPTWTVYSFEDAARVLRQDFTDRFLSEAYSAFPDAKVVEVRYKGNNWDLQGDDIPW